MGNQQAETGKSGKPIPKHMVFMFAIYMVASLVCFGLAIKLHHQAFTPPTPAGSASVLVFTQDPHASVMLQATIDSNSPGADTLSVIPRGPAKVSWLLVVQCAQTGTSKKSQSWLYSELAQSTPIAPAPVTVRPGAGKKTGIKLGCFPATKRGAIANVTLPALETDQAMASAQTTPMAVYAGKTSRADPTSVIQIFLGCPVPTSSQSPSAPTAKPSATASAGSSTPTPTPAPSSGAPVSQGCGPPFTDPALTPYFVPASMQTREVLTDVDLTGYQTETDFPVPEITGGKSGERYTWNGQSSLSPSLLVSNVQRIQNINRWSFDSAVLYGVGAATAVGGLEKLWSIYVEWQKKRARIEASGNDVES
jgi:hypothetical protein